MTPAGFSFTVTCEDCGGDLRIDGLSNPGKTRKATGVCVACGARWVITVAMARGRSDALLRPRLPFGPLRRLLPRETKDAAAQLGIPAYRLVDWQQEGVPAHDAQRAAEAVNRDPTDLWGSAFYCATEDVA